ncbi:MAG: Asp-tRNA(Asn)/Glu-tRNA(Gln) amidotransferase subunit GatA [Chlamydiae bacterium]|nr:Asp-tRNA(Asn)/Glu-tRNA(Gln) amidotransferase subunit GatA [Chlamydiota bacterium]
MINKSAIEINKLFTSGSVKALEIAQIFLGHIEKKDKEIGAFLHVLKDRVLDKAKALDLKRERGGTLGKVAGVPIAIKDNIHIHGEISTCGSRFLEHYRAPFNSRVVELLEEEDALLIGKTNMDEFAMGSSTENSAYQLTRNPLDRTCVPGGSSGGSAAAVSAFMAPIALGSDTGGSIRQPAAFCGNIGFKPSYGRVSRYGLVAFASSLDQIGPIARTVGDVALSMEVLSRPCPYDTTCISLKEEPFTREEHNSIKGMTIAVPWHFLNNLETSAMENFKESIQKLESLGARIIDINLSLLESAISVYYIIATAEASTNLARFDGIRYGARSTRAKTLDEIYDFSKEEGFGQEVKRRILLGIYVLSSTHNELFYNKAQRVRARLIEEFKAIFKKADLIAMPTVPTPAFKIGAIQEPLQMYLSDIYTIGANLAGLPAISLPSGFNKNGLSYGFQLMAAHLNDHLVLRGAYAFHV